MIGDRWTREDYDFIVEVVTVDEDNIVEVNVLRKGRSDYNEGRMMSFGSDAEGAWTDNGYKYLGNFTKVDKFQELYNKLI
jgi:hypothetical protein